MLYLSNFTLDNIYTDSLTKQYHSDKDM